MDHTHNWPQAVVCVLVHQTWSIHFLQDDQLTKDLEHINQHLRENPEQVIAVKACLEAGAIVGGPLDIPWVLYFTRMIGYLLHFTQG